MLKKPHVRGFGIPPFGAYVFSVPKSSGGHYLMNDGCFFHLLGGVRIIIMRLIRKQYHLCNVFSSKHNE